MGSKSSPNLEVCPSEWCWNLQSHGQLKATIFWGASRRICSLEAKNLTCAINQRRSVLSPSKMIKHSVWKSSKNVWKFIIFICPKLFEFPLFFCSKLHNWIEFLRKIGKNNVQKNETFLVYFHTLYRTLLVINWNHILKMCTEKKTDILTAILLSLIDSQNCSFMFKIGFWEKNCKKSIKWIMGFFVFLSHRN